MNAPWLDPWIDCGPVTQEVIVGLSTILRGGLGGGRCPFRVILPNLYQWQAHEEKAPLSLALEYVLACKTIMTVMV